MYLNKKEQKVQNISRIFQSLLFYFLQRLELVKLFKKYAILIFNFQFYALTAWIDTPRKRKHATASQKENPHPPIRTGGKNFTTYNSLFFWKTQLTQISTFLL